MITSLGVHFLLMWLLMKIKKKIEHQIKKAIVDEYAIKSCYDVQISNISLINSKIK